jgi:dynein heavy chain
MIDPQTQANQWVRQMEGSRLLVMRQTQNQKELLMQIENAVQLGLPVLLENVP